jgi:hypothetical protein
LSKLRAALISHASATAFFDTYAEALVARHLLRHGCALRFEVGTPSGKHCDFEAIRDGLQLYLHIKRVHPEGEEARQLTISPRLRYLERIRRPYIVQVRWHEDLSDAQMHRFVARAAEFIGQARVGDELTVRDDDGSPGAGGRELGGVRVVAPWRGTHVSLAIGLPTRFIDKSPRIAKLLGRAYQQFMPKAMNMVIICSMSEDDVGDFQAALLGSPVERWDEAPPRGRRIAHGRAEDGFWHGGRFVESVVAGWFSFGAGDNEIHVRMWQRQEVLLEPPMQDLLGALFG